MNHSPSLSSPPDQTISPEKLIRDEMDMALPMLLFLWTTSLWSVSTNVDEIRPIRIMKKDAPMHMDTVMSHTSVMFRGPPVGPYPMQSI